MPIKTKKWRNLIILIFSFTALIILFEVTPRFWDLLGNVWTIYKNNQKVELVRQYETELSSAKLNNRELKKIINRYVADYEENLKVSSVISSVDDIALNTKVKIISLKPDEIRKEDNLWLQPIEFHLRGSYENFYNLTRLIEQSEKVITIKAFSLEPSRKSVHKLDIILTVDVYLNL